MEDAERAVADDVDWYSRRLHGELGMVPPVEFQVAFTQLREKSRGHFGWALLHTLDKTQTLTPGGGQAPRGEKRDSARYTSHDVGDM